VAVTAAIALLEPHLPAFGLLPLYLLAVLPVAVRWGAGPAAVVSVASTVLFGYLFLPSGRRWWFAELDNAAATAVFLVTAVVVGNLAARLRQAAKHAIDSRAQLAASRARVIAATDATRRQIERDLHDGAQQRLVSLALELRQVESAIPADLPEIRADLGRMAGDLTEALDELRELSRGIHPVVLSEGGLGPALRAIARRAAVPVELDVRTRERFPEPIEVAAYYVVSEAVTNTTKYADATHVRVSLDAGGGALTLRVRDDGAGGADPTLGSGLTGLRDRVEALGGAIRVTSPRGAGTTLDVSLPL